MHEITGNREAVLKLMEDTSYHLAERAGAPRGARAVSTSSASAKRTQQQQFADQLDQARLRQADRKGPRAAALGRAIDADGWYAPRDRVVALFQSAMDEYLTDRVGAPGSATTAKPTKKASARSASSRGRASARTADLADFYRASARGGARAVDINPQFSNLDPGWAKVVWEKAKLLFKGKHALVTHRALSDFRFPMDSTTRVAIVGDWGGGNAAAQAVARQIAKLKPNHVIHLGDVYYSGTPGEVKDRFLKYWPTPRAPGLSFALNSNHEMYSGGYGYFDLTLKRFKQPASYFSLSNEHWRFIGLDTGYDDHDVNGKQREWLLGQFKTAGPKTILLSHHQLFSAFEATDTSKLQAAVQPLLDKKQVYGWIWGHEHLCVAYQQRFGVNAICLGNGCFPYNAPKKKPKIAVQWMDKRTQADPDYRGTHTFALLTLDGPKIKFDFINQDGDVESPLVWT